jgi:signal transduction histidine kinase
MNRKSIRFRITASAAAAVAVVLVVGGAVLFLLQRNVLRAGIDETLAQRADDLWILIQSEPLLPDRFAGDSTEGFAILIGLKGEMLVATPNLSGSPPQWTQQSFGPGERFRTLRGLDVDDDTFRVLSRALNGVGILHVGTSYDVITESSTALIAALAITIPGLVLALGGLVWWLVGRTLRPVENIRSEVAAIEATDLERRVGRPGTGDEIDRLASTMNEMLERLEVSVARQQQFVADASHELRSPLTRMRSELELDMAKSATTEERAVLGGLLDEVIGLQHMVEDLLHLARADASPGLEVFERVDLDDLVIREIRRIRSRERVEVDQSFVSGAHVAGDRSQLSRAIRNLLDNAERHAQSQITVSLRESGNRAVLVIADDGPGIPPDRAEHIFERFGRLDQARSASSGGTGLGLAIAREIIERHHGTIEMIVTPSPGASFEVQLPLAD